MKSSPRRASALWCCAVLLAGAAVACTNVSATHLSPPPPVAVATTDPSAIASITPVSAPPVSAPPVSAPPVSAPPVSAPPVSAPPVSAPPLSTPASTTDRPSTPAIPALPPVGVLGVNDTSCRSQARPVVLLHGTFSTVASNFTAMVPALLTAHRCVFALDYGNGGSAAVTTSAGQIAAFVNSVRTLTGVAQVDVIAYSQGGLVLRTALRLNGLADDVATAVLIAPSWNGTTSPLASAVPAGLCPACADQVAGSRLLLELAAGGDLDGTVRYAEISTRGDTVVTPIASQVPSGPADRVRSIVLQDRCPQLVADHVHLPAVPGVIRWVVSALATDGQPSPADLTC